MKLDAIARFEDAAAGRGLLSRLWRLLAVMGPARVEAPPAPKAGKAAPAPKAPAGKGASAGSTPDHGPDDGVPRNIWGDPLGEDGEGEGDEAPPAAGRKPKPKAKPKDDDLDDEEDLDEEEDEEDDDAELEADEDEDEEEEDDEDLDDEDDDPKLASSPEEEFLRERLITKLKKSVEAGEFHGPRKLNLGLNEVQLRDAAFARYQKALEAADDNDPKAAAKAMFEVAMDAVVQTLGRYHQDGPEQAERRVHERLNKSAIEQRKSEFARTAEGKLVDKNPKLARKMAAFYQEIVEECGMEAALSVPFSRYFKLCGGKLSKARRGDDEDQDDAAERSLRQTRTPKDRRGSRTGRKAKPSNVEQAEERYARFQARHSEPLFSIS